MSLLAEQKKKKMKLTDRIKTKKDYSKYIDGFILFMIVFTSMGLYGNIYFIAVPIAFTVIFVLLQFKRLVNKKVEIKNK
ncbi:unnamed protein product [marine sediment metagenome]|uniref:Uncharacterized protein n=1 Tax=marine sediment metagenome TaxID=412755 RepID=X1C4A8_9ZZZZ